MITKAQIGVSPMTGHQLSLPPRLPQAPALVRNVAIRPDTASRVRLPEPLMAPPLHEAPSRTHEIMKGLLHGTVLGGLLAPITHVLLRRMNFFEAEAKAIPAEVKAEQAETAAATLKHASVQEHSNILPYNSEVESQHKDTEEISVSR